MGAMIVTRRRWLAAAAGLVPLILAARVSAAPYESVPDHDSKDEFKRDCANLGGTFDVGQYSTSCTYRDGDIKVCDENGKSCTYHESESGGAAPSPWANPLGGDPLPVITAQPVTVDADQNGNQGAKPKPQRRKKGGNRRKR